MPQPARRRQFKPAEVELARRNLDKARELMALAAEKLFDLGDVLNALRENDLYLALGSYLSFRNFLRKEGLVPYSTARRYMRLAREYPSANSRKHGIDKLVALLKTAAWEGKNADEIAANDEEVGGVPVSVHTPSSLEALRLANEERRERLEAQRLELENNPALAAQHVEARRTARRLESMFERTIAGPDVETRAVRADGRSELRIRIDISLEDAAELLALLQEHQED